MVQVGDCDVFILLNTQKRGQETSGKAVEFGYALAMGKRCVVVGETSNIFHLLDDVEHVEMVEDINPNFPWTQAWVDLEVVEGRRAGDAGI